MVWARSPQNLILTMACVHALVSRALHRQLMFTDMSRCKSYIRKGLHRARVTPSVHGSAHLSFCPSIRQLVSLLVGQSAS